jgi:hypothetical protein
VGPARSTLDPATDARVMFPLSLGAACWIYWKLR